MGGSRMRAVCSLQARSAFRHVQRLNKQIRHVSVRNGSPCCHICDVYLQQPTDGMPKQMETKLKAKKDKGDRGRDRSEKRHMRWAIATLRE